MISPTPLCFKWLPPGGIEEYWSKYRIYLQTKQLIQPCAFCYCKRSSHTSKKHANCPPSCATKIYAEMYSPTGLLLRVDK